MTRKEMVLDVIKTVWLAVTGLSLMAEPREDLSLWVLALYYLVVMGNAVAAWRYFGRHGMPLWIERLSEVHVEDEE